jgi:hypothetical protein
VPTPRKADRRDIFDPADIYWTIDQAAAHFGFRPATIRKYIREGLPVHFGTFVHREELFIHRQAHIKNLRQSQVRHANRDTTG